MKGKSSFFVQELIKQSNEIEIFVSEQGVFPHVAKLSKDYKKEHENTHKIISTADLISSRYYNESQILIMENTSSLTEYEHYYNDVCLFEFYKMYALRLACNTEKLIEKTKPKLAVRKKNA